MNIDNEKIYNDIKKSPENGFRSLMEQYGEPIYWHIRRLLVSHDDTQDAEQETFIKAFRSIDKLENAKALGSWLFRIATREALSVLEKNKKPQQMLDSIDDGNKTVDIEADSYIDYSDVEAVKLQKAILSLPPKQQLAFNMRYYDEMDYRQIAEVMETSASTAKVNYHLAKEKIIKFMNSND